MLSRIARDGSVRSALFAFALTRVMVLVLFVVASHFSIVPSDYTDGTRDAVISLDDTSIARKLRLMINRADGAWYALIARDGYERKAFDAEREHNWAFFPLYPLVVRHTARLVGTDDIHITAMVVSNFFLFLALFLLHKLARACGVDEAAADRTVFYAAAFPASYFYSLEMTESLFLFLTVGSFYAAYKERWWAAGLFGAFASATRFTGILLLPVLLLIYWQRHGWRPRRELLGVLFVPTGLLLFMLYLYRITGNALAFRDVQAAWGRRTTFFWVPVYEYLMNFKEISYMWDFRLLNFSAAMLAFACGFWLLKRREWALAFYTLLSVFIPLSSGLLHSSARYVSVIFPIFVVLALAGRSPRIDQVIRAVFLVLLGLLAALRGAGISLAYS